jgi:hypothetical protein
VKEWEWWTVLEIRDHIRHGGLNDEEMLEGLKDFDFGEEFPVLVIEHEKQAHFHRMCKVRLN